jgi:large subunit ribosomal protein L6e
MAKPARASRNKELVRGIGRNGRSKTYHKRGLWAIKAKNGGSFPTHQKAAVAAAPAVKAPKFYPADDVPKPLHKNKVINAPKLRYDPSPCLPFCGSSSSLADFRVQGLGFSPFV